MRNAANSFFYVPPTTLPPTAPAIMLSSAPHSFARVFTGAFLEVLAGMLQIESQGTNPTETELNTVALAAGRLIAFAAREADLESPAIFAPVARQVILADEKLFNRRFRSAIITGFTRKGILEVGEDFTQLATKPKRRVAAVAPSPQDIHFPGSRFGLKDCEIVVPVPPQTRQTTKKGLHSTTPWDDAAETFLLNLFRRGRVQLDQVEVLLKEDVVHPPAFLEGPRSHELRPAEDTGGKKAFKVVRRFFDV